MIAKALQLMFFWRRDHWPSIAFKCAFWALLTWLAVGMFTNVRIALTAALVIGVMGTIKYTLKNRKQKQKLMAMCGGDAEKFDALQTRLNAPGMAGTLMREMLNAELDDDLDDDLDGEDGEYDESEPLTDEQRQRNAHNNLALIEQMSLLVRQASLMTDKLCLEVEEELVSQYEEGDEEVELLEIIEAFLPDNVLNICMEDFINEDDHASLVEEFSAATNERWCIEDCTSTYDDAADRWIVSFNEKGKLKTWKFSQSSDWLNEKFLQQLINYTEAKSGYSVTLLDTEDFVSLVCLPSGMYESLAGHEQSLAA